MEIELVNIKVKVNVFGHTIPIEFTSFEEQISAYSLKEGGVYILVNKQHEIIYVGVTNNLSLRVYNHITGHTHTNYFSEEIHSCFYYLEEDVYKREALEKIIIAEFKPKYNKTLSDNGNRKYSDDDIIRVKYLLNTGDYSVNSISKITGYKQSFVEQVKNGRTGWIVKVPEGYTLDLNKVKDDIKKKKKLDVKGLENAYKIWVEGASLYEASTNANIPLSSFKKMLYGSDKKSSELREEMKEKFGSKDVKKKRRITDEVVYKVFDLRFNQNKKTVEIPKLTGISQASVSQILYRLQPRYEKLYNEFINESH